MPSSQAAATERRNDRIVTHEPPKLKTTLKTPPKQATNPLQFVKVGPCSLYRTAQEQLQKVQEVKKIKQEVRDDPEDWQSNLDNWKSSRRKRQEHIIERVVEVKKLELEEHDRHRRRSKTFSEMMEERGSRGRKLSMSLAMYHEEDANDLSDLGIGTSSGKSSVSGDTHDDAQSVLSDRDSEIEKNHSDLETGGSNENANADGNANENNNLQENTETATMQTTSRTILATPSIGKKPSIFDNGFHNANDNRAYESVTTPSASSPEPEEYTYEGAIRGYVSRVTQNIPRRSLVNLDAKLDNANPNDNNEESNNEEKNISVPLVKVDVLKRREIFEKASQNITENKANNINNNSGARSSGDLSNTKTIKERLTSLERQNRDMECADKDTKAIKRLSGDMSLIRERFSHLEKQTSERESKVLHRQISSSELESVARASALDKYTNANVNANANIESSSGSSKIGAVSHTNATHFPHNGEEIATTTVKDRPIRLDSTRKSKEPLGNKKTPLDKQPMRFINEENSTPSERSLSPDSEYRVPRAAFHRSLDSLDADASSGLDTFERVQSLEELDYSNRYPPSSSSAELLNDTDREDSGIHTADVSCSVSQADEPVDEELVHQSETISERQESVLEKNESRNAKETNVRQKIEESQSVEGTELYLPVSDGDGRQQAAAVSASTITTAVTTKESIVTDSSDEETTTRDETSLAVEYEEARIDLEDLVSEPSKSPKLSESISESQREPEIARTVPPPLPLQLSLFTDNALTFDETNTFGMLSPSSKQIPQMNVTSNEEFVTGMNFPLGPSTNVEPPKEKPPPPPPDLSDEENLPVEPLKRLNSTRRIKKELRTRRSDFLGIEGINDDDLEREVRLTKPPDMAAILAAERRIEQHDRRSYDTDSNYEQDSSHERDSGVELGHTEDWSKQPVSPDMSQHSRQSSEPFGASVTSSEEDEITKKEREIIEVLEKEEQWRYGNDREQNSDIGEKLAHKLRELEEEKMQLERDRAQETELRRHEETLRKNDENERKQEEETLRKQQQQQEMIRQQREAERVAETAKRVEEKKLREDELLRIKTEQLRIQEDLEEKERRSADGRRQENMQIRSMDGHTRVQEAEQMAINSKRDDDFSSGEVLRVERELLQLEQEELKRRRTNMAYREQRQLQLAEQLQEQWQSLQDVANVSNRGTASSRYKYQAAPVNYRSSMPNLQLHEGQKRRPPPPPIPPSKPSRLIEQMQRDVTIRNSRIPSADSIPQQVEDGLVRGGSSTTLSNHTGHQMTKETLHALSAVPRSRIVKGDQWVQRRKSDVPRGTQEYNYQHWLIQEAEQRRINEKNQRSVGRKSQQHVTGTSVPYAASSSSRPDGKPLPDSIIQTLTQRVQNRVQERLPPPRRRLEQSTSHEHLSSIHQQSPQHVAMLQHPKVHRYSGGNNTDTQEKMLSVSGKKKCSHCGDELGRGAAMIIESLRLFYHMECFKCCVCHVRLGDGLMGTDVRVRNHKLHCHNCYSSDDGVKFSCV